MDATAGYPFFFQTKAPLIPHSLSVREGEDAGGVNRNVGAPTPQ